MEERETIKKVKDKQGVLSRIQNVFTLGYGTKEDLRELDKKLRDLYYQDLRDLRHVWEDVYLAALNASLTGSTTSFISSRLFSLVSIICSAGTISPPGVITVNPSLTTFFLTSN